MFHHSVSPSDGTVPLTPKWLSPRRRVDSTLQYMIRNLTRVMLVVVTVTHPPQWPRQPRALAFHRWTVGRNSGMTLIWVAPVTRISPCFPLCWVWWGIAVLGGHHLHLRHCHSHPLVLNSSRVTVVMVVYVLLLVGYIYLTMLEYTSHEDFITSNSIRGRCLLYTRLSRGQAAWQPACNNIALLPSIHQRP